MRLYYLQVSTDVLIPDVLPFQTWKRKFKILMGIRMFLLSFATCSVVAATISWLSFRRYIIAAFGQLKTRMIDAYVRKAMRTITTKPEGRCEIGEKMVDSSSFRYFRNAPACLGEMYEKGRRFGTDDFLVYYTGSINRRITFGDALDQATTIKNNLQHNYGMNVGDHIAILCSNIPEFPLSFMAITSLGAVAVTLNAFWDSTLLLYGLTNSESSMVIVDSKRLATLMRSEVQLQDLVKTGLQIVVITSNDAELSSLPSWLKAVDFKQLLLTSVNEALKVVIPCRHPAVLMYTSGTTSRPKGVLLSHESFIQAAYSYVLFWDLILMLKGSPANRTCHLISSPLFHTAPLASSFLLAFEANVKLVLLPRWSTQNAVNACKDEKVTTMGLMPTMLSDLVACPEFAKAKDSLVITNIGTGGASCSSELKNRIASMIVGVSQGSGWALTETNSIGTAIGGPDFLSRPLSCGRALPLADIRVIDIASGNVLLEPNMEGELCIRTICKMNGYWKNDDAEEIDSDGWIRSGDVGKIDEDGFVYITDRLKDLVIRGGENISCASVEDCIYRSYPSGILETCVFGLPHTRYGEQLCAVVCTREVNSVSEQHIREFLEKHLPVFQVPSKIWIREFRGAPLPRGGTGKLLKRELRREYLDKI